MRNRFRQIIGLLAAVASCGMICPSAGFAQEAAPRQVKVLILPHFEVGTLDDGVPGEAQPFYQEYFCGYNITGTEEFDISGGYKLYYNPQSMLAMCITGSGKVNTAVCLTSVLSDARFDFSSAYILGTGCAGSAAGYSVPGDVCLITGVFDADTGHTADPRELKSIAGDKWFYDPSFDSEAYRELNLHLIESLYEQVKSTVLETTQITTDAMKRNFPGEAWADRYPYVILGSSVSSDNYWKGRYDHDKANTVCEKYHAKYPYAMTEMEDIALAITADKFGMLERLVILRCGVNTDVFMDGLSPETLWGDAERFSEKVEGANTETFDIFQTAMWNSWAVGTKIINLLTDPDFSESL